MLHPLGWQLLLKPHEGPDHIAPAEDPEKKLYLPDSFREQQRIASTVCEVIELGPDAYDPEKFGTPWCKVGDWVMIGKYVGARFKYDGVEYRLVNDDQLVARVDDPLKVMPA
jgi:chaperonin GroES